MGTDITEVIQMADKEIKAEIDVKQDGKNYS